MNNYVKNSFVAISDFHSYEYPIEKIEKYYLNEYDKIFILGDATDRGPKGDGTGGIEVLLKIRELAKKYPNRVVYIPGNHDEFLYSAAVKNDAISIGNMQMNGGTKTLQDIEQLKKNNRAKFEDLMTWLGNQPLQVMHEFEGKKYAFAHAFFNQRVYNQKPHLSLKEYDERYIDILWFRKGKYYDQRDVPESGVIEVIGHTPQKNGVRNFDLIDKNGNIVEVKNVDGGIAYNGKMLKYDGGESPNVTRHFIHRNTSPKRTEEPSKPKIAEQDRKIIDPLYCSEKKEFQKYSRSGLFDNLKNRKYIIEELKKGRSILDISLNITVYDNYLESLKQYVEKVAIDYIIEVLVSRFNSFEQAILNINGFIETNELNYISNQGDARHIAKVIGRDCIEKYFQTLKKTNEFDKYYSKCLEYFNKTGKYYYSTAVYTKYDDENTFTDTGKVPIPKNPKSQKNSNSSKKRKGSHSIKGFRKPSKGIIALALAITMSLGGYTIYASSKSSKEDNGITLGQDVETKEKRVDILYKIENGETLDSIANKFGVSVKKILANNPEIKNPDIIKAYSIIEIPDVECIEYTVQENDTLISIASEYNSDINAIIATNNIQNKDLLIIADKLIIPLINNNLSYEFSKIRNKKI